MTRDTDGGDDLSSIASVFRAHRHRGATETRIHPLQSRLNRAYGATVASRDFLDILAAASCFNQLG
jgi:hypothetical protein